MYSSFALGESSGIALQTGSARFNFQKKGLQAVQEAWKDKRIRSEKTTTTTPSNLQETGADASTLDIDDNMTVVKAADATNDKLKGGIPRGGGGGGNRSGQRC